LLELLSYLLVFTFSQVVIEKKKLPKIVFASRFFRVLLLGIVVILGSVIIGIWLNVRFIPASATIFCASVINWKLRSKYAAIERGEVI